MNKYVGIAALSATSVLLVGAVALATKDKEETPTPTPCATPVVEQLNLRVNNDYKPDKTPKPSATPCPTATPSPSATPSATPEPSVTPVPVEPVPEALPSVGGTGRSHK